MESYKDVLRLRKELAKQIENRFGYKFKSLPEINVNNDISNSYDTRSKEITISEHDLNEFQNGNDNGIRQGIYHELIHAYQDQYNPNFKKIKDYYKNRLNPLERFRLLGDYPEHASIEALATWDSEKTYPKKENYVKQFISELKNNDLYSLLLNVPLIFDDGHNFGKLVMYMTEDLYGEEIAKELGMKVATTLEGWEGIFYKLCDKLGVHKPSIEELKELSKRYEDYKNRTDDLEKQHNCYVELTNEYLSKHGLPLVS